MHVLSTEEESSGEELPFGITPLIRSSAHEEEETGEMLESLGSSYSGMSDTFEEEDSQHLSLDEVNVNHPEADSEDEEDEEDSANQDEDDEDGGFMHDYDSQADDSRSLNSPQRPTELLQVEVQMDDDEGGDLGSHHRVFLVAGTPDQSDEEEEDDDDDSEEERELLRREIIEPDHIDGDEDEEVDEEPDLGDDPDVQEGPLRERGEIQEFDLDLGIPERYIDDEEDDEVVGLNEVAPNPYLSGLRHQMHQFRAAFPRNRGEGIYIYIYIYI